MTPEEAAQDRMEILADLAIIDEIHPLGDAIYEVRDREGLGWDGPKVMAYNKAAQRLLARISR